MVVKYKYSSRSATTPTLVSTCWFVNRFSFLLAISLCYNRRVLAIKQSLVSFRAWSITHNDVAFALGVTLLSRLWLAVWGIGIIISNGSIIVPNPPTMYHGLARVPDEGVSLLLAPWQRWDAIWYLRIAQFGYSPTDPSASFFPLFPLLTRVVAAFMPDYLAAALIVSTLATFVAFILLYRLSADLFDDATAQRAVVYWALFPTSFFLLAAYAESTLAATALAAIYFARKERWWQAEIAALAATLARPIGFLILVPLIIIAWQARKRLLAWVPVIGVVLTMGAWMLYLQSNFNDALLWVHAEDAWQRVFVIPGETIVLTVQDILSQQGAVGNNIVDLALTLIAFVAIIAALKKLPPSQSAYGLCLLGVPLLSLAQGSDYALAPMAAAGRRAIVAFPAFIALAAVWHGRWKEPLWLGVSSAVQVILFAMYVKWLWVD